MKHTFVFILGLLSSPFALAHTQSCRSADDISAYMINALKHVVASTDSPVVASRNRGFIPAVHPDSVFLVTDETLCSQMATAYSSGIPMPRPDGRVPSGRVYVVKVGTVFVVHDPAIMNGEFAVHMVINAQGTILSRYGS